MARLDSAPGRFTWCDAWGVALSAHDIDYRTNDPCSLPCQVIDLQPTCNRRAARTVSTVRVANRREGGHLVPATTRSAAGRLGTATRRAASAAAGLGTSTRGTDTAPTGTAGTGMGPAAPLRGSSQHGASHHPRKGHRSRVSRGIGVPGLSLG